MNVIKASDLFAVCDQEQKGFVTKRDMQRMRDELPLDPDQLEAVFDALDADGNSYLTVRPAPACPCPAAAHACRAAARRAFPCACGSV